MHGAVGFPTTVQVNGVKEFYRVITMFSSFERPPGIAFGKVSPGGEGVTLFADMRLLAETSPALSVVSAFQAFVQATGKKTGDVFVWYSPDEKDISGASEGLATLLSLLGHNTPKNVCVTGTVKVFGFVEDGMGPLMQLQVGHVDCVPEKIAGCNAAGIRIGYPREGTGDLPGGTALITVADAVKFIYS